MPPESGQVHIASGGGTTGVVGKVMNLQIFKSFFQAKSDYRLMRLLFLRAVGGLYFIAFLVLFHQGEALIGERGLLPVDLYLKKLESIFGSNFSAYFQIPTIFWLHFSDNFLLGCSVLGLLLSGLAILGVSNSLTFLLLWIIYLSVVHVGQVFYSYGWESILLETGFLCILFAPFNSFRVSKNSSPPSLVIVLLLRWTLFRVMFGAGMIKLRTADSCWKNLTCLMTHYETQPNPNPISWYLHQMPEWFHQSGVLFNHFAELFVPFLYFAPRNWRHFGALITILFQSILIISGNLSYLNWITIVLCIPCLDDQALHLPWCRPQNPTKPLVNKFSINQMIFFTGIGCVYILLSIPAAINLLSTSQSMNRSYNPFHIANTYGAFGTVSKKRFELVIEGSPDEKKSEWREYEFKCKPGRVNRPPCLISPYHYRLDWQIWFPFMSSAQAPTWFVHFTAKLLAADPMVLDLLEFNPFPDKAPKFIQTTLYLYEFTAFGEKEWWKRTKVKTYLPPLSLNNPHLLKFLVTRNYLKRLQESFPLEPATILQ